MEEDPCNVDKKPTDKIAALDRLTLELDLEDHEAVASFLDAVALSIRRRRKIKLIIE